MPRHVEGADLHRLVGHRVLVDDAWALLRWADPDDNGLLLRVRTAERGREYLVRAGSYPVSDAREPATSDDDPDRWDNEPPLAE